MITGFNEDLVCERLKLNCVNTLWIKVKNIKFKYSRTI